MNTGQIIKSRGGDKFAQVNNAVLQNDKLSMQAKGLYAYLQSLPGDWVIYKKELSDHFTNGRDAVFSAFKELQDVGLVLTVKVIGNTGKVGYNHIVYPEYQLERDLNMPNQAEKPCTGKPRTENQCTENPSLQIEHRTNKHKQINIISGEEFEIRKTNFIQLVNDFTPKYGQKMIDEFCSYWTEANSKKTKMRFEEQKFFEISRRLATWARNLNTRLSQPNSGFQSPFKKM